MKIKIIPAPPKKSIRLRVQTVHHPVKIRIKPAPQYFSLHTHSKFSANDAMPSVQDIVAQAKVLGYRGLGLTDHGNMAGSIQLYQECAKVGIKPFPGTEMYLVKDKADLKAKRYHFGVLAYTSEGYKNLVGLNTRAARQFYNKPIVDLADLAELSEAGLTQGLAILTGCHFGLVVQTLIQEGIEAALQIVACFAQWFPDSTYVELQNHHIDQDGWTDAMVADQLQIIATELSLPVVLTQDSHYIHPSERPLHDSLKTLVSYGSEVDDAVFPGDGFHMVDDAWMQDHFSASIYQRGMAGLNHLLAKHTLCIPTLDRYNYQVPFTVLDPEDTLRQRCLARMVELGLTTDKYYERLEHELDILHTVGMAGYLVLVAEVTDYCRAHDIFFQARGSAAGSLLCYLSEITPVDPLKWGLLMERFLSKDRTKPPDVDLDIESTRRKELMDWLATRFSVLQIGSWGKYSISGDEDGKGSLRVRYFSSERNKGKDPKWEEVSGTIRAELDQLSAMGLYSGNGVHASGLLLTTTKQEMEELVPQMYIASSKTFVSQYDMKDVEKLGLVKLDVLGLKTMSVLRQTILNMKRAPKDGLDFIPLNDPKTFQAVSKGDTVGVFQLEGGTAARGMRELKPSHIRDIIASMALYRPATMHSGATEAYVLRKHRAQKVPARHGIIATHTKDTYGILLYQEQVISVLRDLGMEADDLTAFLKAVKASNGDIGNAAGVIHDMLTGIKVMCHAKGMTEEDIHWLEQALEAYAGYGFNQAHATVYGITAYRCAWLATNHPLEFHAALLAVAAGTPKEDPYVRATRKRGIRILPPDVNYSGERYQVDPKGRGVRKGFLSIHRVGEKAAAALVAAQPFADVAYFKANVNPRAVTGTKDMPADAVALAEAGEAGDLIGIVGRLYEAEAFRSILGDDS